MFEPATAWSRDLITGAGRFLSGLVTGLLVIWLLPAMLRGSGAVLMIGTLVIIFH